MAQKLIKINPDHYVVVDDSEIKEGDWKLCLNDNSVSQYLSKKNIESDTICQDCKKITHSTQPLEGEFSSIIYKGYNQISLQEVKELLGIVDVEKKAKYYYGQNRFTREYEDGFMLGFKLAYNQALEDNKEKIAMFICKYLGAEKHSRVYDIIIKDWEQSLQPKTSWEVEIVDGKLKLK